MFLFNCPLEGFWLVSYLPRTFLVCTCMKLTCMHIEWAHKYGLCVRMPSLGCLVVGTGWAHISSSLCHVVMFVRGVGVTSVHTRFSLMGFTCVCVIWICEFSATLCSLLLSMTLRVSHQDVARGRDVSHQEISWCWFERRGDDPYSGRAT